MESSPPWCLPYITPPPPRNLTPLRCLLRLCSFSSSSYSKFHWKTFLSNIGQYRPVDSVGLVGCGGERDGCFQIWLWNSYIEFIHNFTVVSKNQDYPLSICFLVNLTRTNIWYVPGLVHMNAIIEWKICQKYMTLKNCLKDWFTQILTEYTVINGNHPL